MCLSESDYSDYDFTSTVHYDNCTTLSLVVSTFPLPLTSQDPIVPIVFRDPSSIVVVSTVIYELQIRATTELLKETSQIYFSVTEKRVSSGLSQGWVSNSHMIYPLEHSSHPVFGYFPL